MADGNIVPFSARQAAFEAQRPSLKLVEPAPVEPRDRVEITAGLTKTFAVRVDGVIRNEFHTATNAIRCREHLNGLIALGALHPAPPTNPTAA